MEDLPSNSREPLSKSEGAIIGCIAVGTVLLVPSVLIDKIPDNTTIVLWTTAVFIAFGNALANRN